MNQLTFLMTPVLGMILFFLLIQAIVFTIQKSIVFTWRKTFKDKNKNETSKILTDTFEEEEENFAKIRETLGDPKEAQKTDWFILSRFLNKRSQ